MSEPCIFSRIKTEFLNLFEFKHQFGNKSFRPKSCSNLVSTDPNMQKSSEVFKNI